MSDGLITVEQFKAVLQSEYARQIHGLDFANRQVDFILASEGSTFAYYKTWTDAGQPRLTPATGLPADVSKTAPSLVRQPWTGMGIGSFALAVVNFLFFQGLVYFGVIFIVAAAAVGALALLKASGASFRGRGLSVAALILSLVSFISRGYMTIVHLTTGAFILGAW